MTKDNTQRDVYRQCFTAPKGRECLTMLLIKAGYFRTDLKTTEELAVLNFAKGILKDLGLYEKTEIGRDCAKSITLYKYKLAGTYVNKILDLPIGD